MTRDTTDATARAGWGTVGVAADGYLCVCGHMSIDHYDNGPINDPRASFHCARCVCDVLQEADDA